jgi:hypothetical protein
MYNIHFFISLFHRGSRGAYAFIVLQSCHEISSIFYVITTQSLANQLSVCTKDCGCWHEYIVDPNLAVKRVYCRICVLPRTCLEKVREMSYYATHMTRLKDSG